MNDAVFPVPFSVEPRPERSRAVLAVRGDVDIASVALLGAAVEELRLAGWTSIVLDLHEVTFIDSQGLHLLLQLDDDARAEGWELALANGSRPLTRLLEVTGLSDHFRRA